MCTSHPEVKHLKSEIHQLFAVIWCTPIIIEALPVPNVYTISQQTTGVFRFLNVLLQDVMYTLQWIRNLLNGDGH